MMSHDRAAINQEIIRFILALSYVAVQVASASFALKPCFALEPCRIAQTASEPNSRLDPGLSANSSRLLLSRAHSQLISIPGCADRSIRNGQRL